MLGYFTGRHDADSRGRRVRVRKSVSIAFLLLFSGNAYAQSPDKEEKESVAVIELGGATSWNVKGGGWALGPTVAVEVTPIEKWLELEGGVTPLFSSRSTEWSADLLLKKPWTLSDKVEFMVGAGPEWVHTNEPGKSPNSVSGEAVIDAMFWHSKKHRFGWYVEPGYEYNFGRGHEQSLGVSGGLLIAIP